MFPPLQAASGSTNISVFGSLLFLLFILVPGYISLRSFHFFHISIDDRSRWDKLAVMIIGGLLSLVVVVMIYVSNPPSLGLLLLSKLSEKLCADTNFVIYSIARFLGIPDMLGTYCTPLETQYTRNPDVQFQEISRRGVLAASGIIFVQSILATFLGYSYGVYRRRLDPNPQMREELAEPWERAYQVSKPGTEVIVVTNQNRMIKGEVQQLGSPSKEYDVLLVNPREVKSRSGGAFVEEPLGGYSYHNQDDISRIEFLDPEDTWDPDSLTRGNRYLVQEIGERLSVCSDTVRFDMLGMSEEGAEAGLSDEEAPDDMNVEIEDSNS